MDRHARALPLRERYGLPILRPVVTEERPAPLLLEPRDVFDDCLLGYGYRPGDPCEVPIYDRDLVILAHARWTCSPVDEADEFVSFNTEGAWLGAGTPMLLNRCTAEEFEAGLDDDDAPL